MGAVATPGLDSPAMPWSVPRRVGGSDSTQEVRTPYNFTSSVPTRLYITNKSIGCRVLGAVQAARML